MASIGDLIMRVVADMKGFTTSVTKEAEKAGDKAAGGFKAKFAKGAGKGNGILQGLGIGAGFATATAAISTITGALGDMVQAAIDDEASVSRLGASLKANIRNFDGNTDAIEANIAAKQRLGFDDETLRDSLTVLAGATHNVDDAFKTMGVAMDLARFKNIDLRTASEALIKVEGGAYRSLKQLGIKLRDGATATEALAAVQAVARGQAEAYADTVGGKQLANQIALNESLENLGKIILPTVTDAIEGATIAMDAFTGVQRDTIQGLERETYELMKGGEATLDQVKALRERVRLTREASRNKLTTQSEVQSLFRSAIALDQMAQGMQTLAWATDRAQPGITGVSAALIEATRAADDSKVAFKDWSARVIQSSSEVRRALVDDARSIVDDAFDPIIARDRLAADNAELAAARRVLASDKATKAEKRDARETLHSVGKDREQTLLDLAEAGELSQREIAKHLRQLEKEAKGKTGAAKAAFQRLIDKWKELQRLGSKTITLTVKQQTAISKRDPKHEIRDSGGPVTARTPYAIGLNRRPEIFVPSTSGHVLTQSQAAQALAGSGGGAGMTVNIGSLDRSTMPDAIRELRRIDDVRRMRTTFG